MSDRICKFIGLQTSGFFLQITSKRSANEYKFIILHYSFIGREYICVIHLRTAFILFDVVSNSPHMPLSVNIIRVLLQTAGGLRPQMFFGCGLLQTTGGLRPQMCFGYGLQISPGNLLKLPVIAPADRCVLAPPPPLHMPRATAGQPARPYADLAPAAQVEHRRLH